MGHSPHATGLADGRAETLKLTFVLNLNLDLIRFVSETGDFVDRNGNFLSETCDFVSGNKIAGFGNKCGQAFSTNRVQRRRGLKKLGQNAISDRQLQIPKTKSLRLSLRIFRMHAYVHV